MIKQLLLSLFLPLILSVSLVQAYAQKSVKVLPVPSFGYSPETGSYVGAVALFTLDFYKDSITRTSNAKIEFNYTWRRQIILETEWNYFFREENWYTLGLVQYMKFPDYYYGIGAHTQQQNEVLFQSNRFVADINVLKKIGNRLFLGPRVRSLNYSGITYTPANRDFTELADARINGGGATLLKDTRNNLLNPSSGSFIEFSPTCNFAKNYSYTKVLTDIRGYRTVWDKLILSGRLLNEFTFGTPPFYDYSLMGSDSKVRGIYYGRYRDRNLSTIQAEARMIIAWRLGLAVFGGFSKVYPDVRSLAFSNIITNFGGGIRFVIDRKQNINLRFDYAIAANGQDGFYVAFGESF